MPSESQALTLWVSPALAAADVADISHTLNKKRLASWHRLLAKGDLVPQQPKDVYAKAAYLMHQKQMPGIAATEASYQVLGFSEEDFWLKVTPVHLRPDRDTLVLIPEDDLQISAEEAKSLKFAFNQHFETESISLEGTDQAWFLRLPQAIDFHSETLDCLKYASLQDRYPKGASAGYWRRLMNEAQMLFHEHKVNQQRRAEGRLEINSVWIWGEGKLNLDAIQPRKEAHIWSEHPYLKGLAKLTQAYQSPQVTDYKHWQNQVDCLHSRHHLLQVSPPVISNATEYLEWLEDCWFSPIAAGLAANQLHSVYIDFDYNLGWLLEPSFLKRFWRRSIPFKMIK